MTSVEFDTRELTVLADDMVRASEQASREIAATLEKGAVNIKKRLRADFRQSAHFKQVARTVDYDRIGSDDQVRFEIGPNTDFASAHLENIAYFGGSNGGGGTVPDPRVALDAETPAILRYVDEALGRLL